MTDPLYWLTLTIAMTALFWVVYSLNSIAVRGLTSALANPSPDQKPLAAWAQRAKAAHYNAIENLVIFGLLILPFARTLAFTAGWVAQIMVIWAILGAA